MPSSGRGSLSVSRCGFAVWPREDARQREGLLSPQQAQLRRAVLQGGAGTPQPAQPRLTLGHAAPTRQSPAWSPGRGPTSCGTSTPEFVASRGLAVFVYTGGSGRSWLLHIPEEELFPAGSAAPCPGGSLLCLPEACTHPGPTPSPVWRAAPGPEGVGEAYFRGAGGRRGEARGL